MIFKTAGDRVEVDVHIPSLFRLRFAGTFIRLPLLGEAYRDTDGTWVRTPWIEVKAQLEAQEARQRDALAQLEQDRMA